MKIFIPFQHLYQQFKSSDIRLYDTFEKVQENLKILFESITIRNYFISYNLESNTNISSPTKPIEGATLTILLLFLGAGGWTIAWDSSFGTVPALTTTAPTYSTLQFIGHNDRWWLVSFLTGIVR